MDNATRRSTAPAMDARGAARGRRSFAGFAACLAAAFALLAASPTAQAQDVKLRIGHFPNVTHVQALVARNMERQGRPWFSPDRLGSPGLKVEWYVYNAGPSAMEAIFADTLDLT